MHEDREDMEGAAANLEGRRLMDMRARVLARRTEVVEARDRIELLVLATGRERFAIETRYVREIAPLSPMTPVPDLPVFLLGVVNYDGGVLPVADLRALVSGTPGEEPKLLVVLDDASGTQGVPELGLAVGAAVEITHVAPDDIVEGSLDGSLLVRGVVSGSCVVLHGDRILVDPRLFLTTDGL